MEDPILSNAEDPILINVGGTRLHTTRSTLLKSDNMLRRMFSGAYKLTTDKEGNPFIDR